MTAQSNTVWKIKNKKTMIRRILLENPICRDNDQRLIMKVWAKQNPEIKNPEYKLRQFAQDFVDGKYADPETIRRTRQKLQQEEPETRGKLWHKRHDEGDATRNEIGDA